MKRIAFRPFCLPMLFVALLHNIKTAGQAFEQLSDGVIVHLPNQPDSNAKALRLQLITPQIIRVTASQRSTIPELKSLMVLPVSGSPGFSLRSTDRHVHLQTDSLNAFISLANGRVWFTDKSGNIILNEKENGRLLVPAPVDGEHQYHLEQVFESPENEGLYGLGQHQEGIMNYKNSKVTLLQQNSDVGVPFVVSTRNYGLLWDNYSITNFGDTRPYKALASLQVTDKQGQPGALTATYVHGDSVVVSRREMEINYPYLDNMSSFPEGFKLDKGRVTWEGTIMPQETGDYKFHLYAGGYVKLWINGELLYDSWRQSWNPASGKYQVTLQKEQPASLKLEWIPDGGESYIALQALPPIPEAAKNQFAFSSEAGDAIDYYFIAGHNIDSVISGYRKLTGKATMLPKWAYGFWQSRERYKTQQEVLETVAEFRKRHIGLDNIVLDWSYWKEDQWGSHDFDTTRFPNVKGLINTLHNKYQAHFMISVWPKYYTNTANYTAMNSKGYLYKRNVALGRRDWIGKGYTSTFYDAYNPGARQMFWNQLSEKLYSKGVDAWWLDATEPDIHSNVSIEDRKDFMNPTALGNSTKYFNAYALQNARGVYEGQRAAAPNKRVFILTRSAYGGLQRYAAATWSGDIGARWRDMKTQIAAGLNFSMSGLPYWTMDIGGFAVERRYENPNEADKKEWQELQTRWYQFGAFAPLFRVHGQYPYREIYNIAPEGHPAYESMLHYNRLRYRLMPYIYSLAGMIYHDNYTIMRGLVMDFPQDEKVKNINDQFLFGPALLVNPVATYGATSRPVYLPAGAGWYNADNGEFFTGGQTIDAAAPYESMPLFIKAGSIVPMGPAMEYTMQKPADTLTVFVYTGANGKFTLYEDQGLNYNYEKGKFSTIPMIYDEEKKTFRIGTRTGSFEGMLTNRVIRIIPVSKNAPLPLDASQPAAHTVTYKGQPLTVVNDK